MARSRSSRKTSSAYVSGFRLVQDSDRRSHCEYGLHLGGRCSRWVRFSQVKAVFNALPLPEASREAWEVVRQCKPPRGVRLETSYLARKCMAIENFLCTLLLDDELDISCAYIEELLLQVPAARARPRRAQRISRGRAGLRISMR